MISSVLLAPLGHVARLCGVLLLAGSAVAHARAAAEIPFEDLARGLLAQCGLDSAQRVDITIDRVLAAHCARAELGMFEVHFPRSGLEKSGELLKRSAVALVEAHGTWIAVRRPAGIDAKALQADVATVAKWVRAWKPAALAKLELGADADLIAALEPAEGVRAALGRVRTAVRSAAGDSLELRPAARLILMPTRRHFVAFASFLGWLAPHLQDEFWRDSMGDWTQCFYEKDQIIALEYASPDRKARGFEAGLSMSERGSNVLEQQVAQLALNSWLDRVLGSKAPAAFSSGVGMNLVIDQYGVLETRVDGDVRSRTTEAIEVFIPGGASEGGILAGNSAESRWRKDRGKDRFATVLRDAQKQGDAMDGRSKTRGATFALRSDGSGKTFALTAPVLGAAQGARPDPPVDFRGDQAEFVRAYKCCFVHWLETEAAGNEKASREKFAELLAKLEDASGSEDFETAVASTYDGTPLSNAAADKSSLEGRFLAWLAKR